MFAELLTVSLNKLRITVLFACTTQRGRLASTALTLLGDTHTRKPRNFSGVPSPQIYLYFSFKKGGKNQLYKSDIKVLL
jgi:hypothetical protein